MQRFYCFAFATGEESRKFKHLSNGSTAVSIGYEKGTKIWIQNQSCCCDTI